MKKVSLAMTTYNGEKYIVNQMVSIKNQTRPFDEVVICDDNSKDKTVQIVTDYIINNDLSNWKILTNEVNIGFANNFKKAISNTTGDIIFLADQDDEWCPTKVERMTECMQHDGRIQLLASSLSFIDEFGKPLELEVYPVWYRRMHKYEENELIQIDFMSECTTNFSPGCTMSFTREIAQQYLTSAYPYQIHHDWLIGLLAAAEGKFFFYNKPLIYYRIHRNNTIGVKAGKKSETQKEQINKLQRLLSRYELGERKDKQDENRLKYNIAYTKARLELYQTRKLNALINTWKKSAKATKIYSSIWQVNIKDLLFWMHIIY